MLISIIILFVMYRISGECAHILALVNQVESWLIAGHQQVPDAHSCTSMASKWIKPRGKKVLPEAATTMIFSKATNVARKRRPVVAFHTDNRLIYFVYLVSGNSFRWKIFPSCYFKCKLFNHHYTSCLETHIDDRVNSEHLYLICIYVELWFFTALHCLFIFLSLYICVQIKFCNNIIQ